MEGYINSAFSISPQDTFDLEDFFLNFKDVPVSTDFFECVSPDYKQYIDPRQLRRMSKVIRMGVACSKKALEKAGIVVPEGIHIGTGLGCLNDTDKFLAQITENNESLLNPTAFIQSTHNTVSGQIALNIACKNYNLTFSQAEVSFETALIDALLFLQQNNKQQVLVGGIDELIETSMSLMKKAGCVKTENNVSGYIPGEGSSFFVVSKDKTEKSIAKISHLSAFNSDSYDVVFILGGIGADVNSIDVVISGENGVTEIDNESTKLKSLFPESVTVAYKHVVGEYNTASAFAMCLGTKFIEQQTIPKVLKTNNAEKDAIKRVLIHHYSPEYKHSFILLDLC